MYLAQGIPVNSTFWLFRARNALSILAAATGLVPSEVLGVVGMVSDYVVVRRLLRHVSPDQLLRDRSLSGIVIAHSWAIAFNSRRFLKPWSLAIPAVLSAAFAFSQPVPARTALRFVAKEGWWGAVVLHVVSELSINIGDVIRNELIDSQNAQLSTAAAAQRRSRKRIWLVGIHNRLGAIAAARWAAAGVADRETDARELVQLAADEEQRLRRLFEEAPIPLDRVLLRIAATREATGRQTLIDVPVEASLTGIDDSAEPLVEWLVEAFCPFADGTLSLRASITSDHVEIVLEAEDFPLELMAPFRLTRERGKQVVAGVLPLAKE